MKGGFILIWFQNTIIIIQYTDTLQNSSGPACDFDADGNRKAACAISILKFNLNFKLIVFPQMKGRQSNRKNHNKMQLIKLSTIWLLQLTFATV